MEKTNRVETESFAIGGVVARKLVLAAIKAVEDQSLDTRKKSLLYTIRRAIEITSDLLAEMSREMYPEFYPDEIAIKPTNGGSIVLRNIPNEKTELSALRSAAPVDPTRSPPPDSKS